MLTATQKFGTVISGAQNSILQTRMPHPKDYAVFLCPFFVGSVRNIIPFWGITPHIVCCVLSSRHLYGLKSQKNQFLSNICHCRRSRQWAETLDFIGKLTFNFTNRIKCASVFIELEKLNRTETAPESMRYIYARFLCREVANKAMPNKRARFCRVFQLPTPDGFRLPMKKETENAKHNKIRHLSACRNRRGNENPRLGSGGTFGNEKSARHSDANKEKFGRTPEFLPNLGDAEKGKCRLGINQNGRIFLLERRTGLIGLYFVAYGKSKGSSPRTHCPLFSVSTRRIGKNEYTFSCRRLAIRDFEIKSRMGKDSSLSSGGAFGQRNRKSHREKPNNGQYGVTAYARLRISRPFGFGTQIRSAFGKTMGKVIKLPQKRIYKPDVSRKVKEAIKNGKITFEDLDFALKIREILNRV